MTRVRRGWLLVLALTLRAGAALAQVPPAELSGPEPALHVFRRDGPDTGAAPPDVPGAAAAPAPAPAIALRAGAHPGFDRLVVPLPPGTGWDLAGDGRSRVLRIAGGPAAPRYDPAPVFERIGRDRLRDLTMLPDGGLRLDLDCACDLAASTLASGWLVIDIRSPAAPATALRPRPRPPRDTAAAEGGGPGPAGTALTGLPLVAAPRAPLLPIALPDAAGTGAQATAATGAATLAPLADPPVAAIVAEARAGLIARLGEAAQAGLVTPAPEQALPLPPAGPVLPAPGAAHGLAVTSTALDPPRMEAPARAAPQADACPEPADIDLAAWGTADPPTLALARARAGLSGEFDRVDPEAALRLAQLYLHFGLGAEARLVLHIAAAPPPEAERIAWLAAVLDDPAGLGGALPPPQPGCRGPAALWDIFRAPDPATLSAARLTDALEAFAALPPHLRRHLGPTAARRLAAAGRADAAALVTSATRRAADGTAGDSPEEAMLDRARTARAAGRPLPEAARAVLAAMAFELRRHPLGADLKAEQILTTAAAGDPAAAYAAWADALDDTPEHAPLPDDLGRQVLGLTLDAATDPVLALLFHRHRALFAAGYRDAPALRRALAQRLLATGLPAAAAEVAGPDSPPEGMADPEDRLIAAAIALARGRPQAALGALDGLDTPAAQRLRLRAETGSGALAAAQQTARSLADPVAIARTDWRAGDRARARDTAGPRHRTALALLGADPATGAATGPATAPRLSQLRRLLDDSAAARATLADLLTAPDPAPPAAAAPMPERQP